jgi:hypothetical protein
VTCPNEAAAILAVYDAEPETHLGVEAVMRTIELPFFRALHEIGRALNDRNKDVDFSKYRERLPP